VAADQIPMRAMTVTAAPPGTPWTYTTVVADAKRLLPVRPDTESLDLQWVSENEVARLPLHPGFAASWPALRTLRFGFQVDEPLDTNTLLAGACTLRDGFADSLRAAQCVEQI
jgi:hypothetical protein